MSRMKNGTICEDRSSRSREGLLGRMQGMAAVMPYNYVTYGVWVWYNRINKVRESEDIV